MTKNVTNKWFSDLAVIYKVGDLLLFYNASKDPNFTYNQSITLEEAEASEPYKALKFSTDKIPDDMVQSLAFAWSMEKEK